jgi:hypothetical protein
MGKIDLSIIIVDYKSKKFLFDCLLSIKEHILNIKYEVIIIDHNQEQEFRIQNSELSKIMLPAPYSLLPADNNGFGAGNNLGTSKANGEYLFLLNPDTLIIDDSIEKMFHFLKKHEEIGALTCLLYNRDRKTLQKAFFGKFQSLGSLTLRHYNYQKINPPACGGQEFFYTDIVTGAALIIRKKLYDRIKGFDEHFFMYLEDDDLSKRIVNLGYKNAVLNTAKIIHLEGKSSNNKQRKYYYYKSQDYYWQKHNGKILTLIMRILRWPYKQIKQNK